MHARQIRLTTTEEIQKRLKDFSGKKINIVLRSRAVFFGELKSVDEQRLLFVNMRQQTVQVSLGEISEVYLDMKE